ncbi:MAG TPA: citrate synthase/methylcitrate synthase, partial [Anaerolineae bacterium]|nr:citrate synthase/methylcitrate synthase [Anaerolineae bacterium]
MTITAVPKGLEGVVAATTRISHVDGLAGELIIGGYCLDEIAGRATFEEIAFVLWQLAMGHSAELPTLAEYKALVHDLAELRPIPDAVLQVIRAAQAAPPMDALRMALAMMSLEDPDVKDESAAANYRRAKLLTACTPTIIAAHDRLRRGLEPIAPRPQLDRAANFLYMITGQTPAPEAARALDTYWTTVIDHGMNASTFTARVIASTQSDMVSAITGAVGALKGPLHGGAPGPVLDMLVEIKTLDRAEEWVRTAIARGDRMMGFGHRVYKVRDPRADVLSAAARRLADSGSGDRALYDLAIGVEQIILKVLEEVKPGRNLKTNVEFFTALVLQSVGLTSDQFSATFAAGRIAGWSAHVLEQQAENRLIRPASEYVGPRDLKYVPLV